MNTTHRKTTILFTVIGGNPEEIENMNRSLELAEFKESENAIETTDEYVVPWIINSENDLEKIEEYLGRKPLSSGDCDIRIERETERAFSSIEVPLYVIDYCHRNRCELVCVFDGCLDMDEFEKQIS